MLFSIGNIVYKAIISGVAPLSKDYVFFLRLTEARYILLGVVVMVVLNSWDHSDSLFICLCFFLKAHRHNLGHVVPLYISFSEMGVVYITRLNNE